MPESYPLYAGGQRITASLLRSAQVQSLRKTADTPITASTITTPDPHLQFTAEANAVYTWWGWVKYSADAAGDLNVDFTAPAGALGEWFGAGAGNPVTGASSTPTLRVDTQGASGYMVRTETTDVTSARSFGGLGSGITLGIALWGTLRMAATAGTFSLDWAQATSSATATVLYTDSWINLQRTA